MRRGRGLLAGVWLWFVLAALSMLIGCSHPTDPTPVDSGPVPRVVTRGRPDLQADAEVLLDGVVACVGGPPIVLERFPVDVVPDPFLCGSIMAAGCFHFLRIEVVERWFADALWHEYIHMVLYKQGQPFGHSSPAFAKCDGRNVGKSIEGGTYHDLGE